MEEDTAALVHGLISFQNRAAMSSKGGVVVFEVENQRTGRDRLGTTIDSNREPN